MAGGLRCIFITFFIVVVFPVLAAAKDEAKGLKLRYRDIDSICITGYPCCIGFTRFRVFGMNWVC